MFELPDPTAATLSSVTCRTEQHGEDKVPAVSLGLTIETGNEILDRIDRLLRPALYKRDEEQKTLPGVAETMPLLRMPALIDAISFHSCMEGWTLIVEHGIDDTTAIKLPAAKVDKLRVHPKSEGVVELSLRVGTSAVSAEAIGLLSMKLGQEVAIRLTAPKKAIDASADGDAPIEPAKKRGKKQPDATQAFLAAQGATVQ